MSMNLPNLDWATWTHALVHALAIPEVGLGAIFVVALVSATLVPMGSEPAVWALVKLQPELFWPAVLVATAGNTLGGAITWWMGRGAQLAWARARAGRHRHGGEAGPTDQLTAQAEAAADSDPDRSTAGRHAQAWLKRWGAPACVLAWLPVVGDPLCAVAGWLHLPFWPCVAWMAVGKFFRYLVFTATLVQFF
jgi:membrane protein YqaA with SNARE-associated domain